MEMMMNALGWLLSGAVFWVVIACVGLFTITSINSRSYVWAAGLTALLVFCFAFHFDGIGEYILANPLMVVAWFVAYLAIGVFVSIGKWVYVVRDSKPGLLALRTRYENQTNDSDDNQYGSFEEYFAVHFDSTSGSRSERWVETQRQTKFLVRNINGKDTIVLNTKSQPIPEWILFWPVTLLTYILEPLLSIVKRIAGNLGHLYDNISAKMLS